MRPPTSRSRTGLPSTKMRPDAMRMAAHHAFEKLASSGAHQPVDADNLAGANRQRDMVDGVAAGYARQADVVGAERLPAKLVIARGREVLGVGADHLAHDPMRRRRPSSLGFR